VGCGWAVGLAADVSNSLPRRRWPSTWPPLQRLKRATMRRLAFELLITAKTQRRAPEELTRRRTPIHDT
jgi:hypothetical protein